MSTVDVILHFAVGCDLCVLLRHESLLSVSQKCVVDLYYVSYISSAVHRGCSAEHTTEQNLPYMSYCHFK